MLGRYDSSFSFYVVVLFILTVHMLSTFGYARTTRAGRPLSSGPVAVTDMENAVADHTAALTGVRTAQEFQALEEESKRAREEVSRLGAELAAARSLRAAE